MDDWQKIEGPFKHATEHSRKSRSRGDEGMFNALTLSLLPSREVLVMNRVTKRCLEMKKDTWSIYVHVVQTCTTQAWTIQYTMQNWGSN